MEEVQRLEAEVQMQGEKLSEQQVTFQEVLDSSQLLGEAALKGEHEVQELQEELFGIRLAYQMQREELASCEMALEDASNAEKQAVKAGGQEEGLAGPRTARSSSPIMQGEPDEVAGRRALTPRSRPLPPRSPTISVASVAQGSSRPPRSPPAVTGRSCSPLPSPSFGFPDLTDEMQTSSLSFQPEALQQSQELLAEEMQRPSLLMQPEVMQQSRRPSAQCSISSPLSDSDPVGSFTPAAAELESNLEELESATYQLQKKHEELKQSILHSEELQEELAQRRLTLETPEQRPLASMPAPVLPPVSVSPDPRTGELHAEILAQMQEEERRWRKRLQVERRKAAAAALRAVSEEASEHEASLRQELQQAVDRSHLLQEELTYPAQQALLASAVSEVPMVPAEASSASLEEVEASQAEDDVPEAPVAMSRAVQVQEPKSNVERLESEVEALKQEAQELPRLRSLLDAAEKRLLKSDSDAELQRIRDSLQDQNQMAVLSAMQGAKDTEDMLRSALAAETTCELMAESAAERAKSESEQAHKLLQEISDAGRSELLAVRAWMQEELADSSSRLGEAQEALHLAGEGEEAMVRLREEEVSAAEARAAVSQEKATRSLELQAAGWFYFGETEGWSEGETAEAQVMQANRQEEARLLDQRDASIHAATTEAGV